MNRHCETACRNSGAAPTSSTRSPTNVDGGFGSQETHEVLRCCLLAVALGVAGIVAGEADDSPGLQLIGALLIVGAVAMGVRIARRRK